MKVEVNGNGYDIVLRGRSALINGREVETKRKGDTLVIGCKEYRLDFFEGSLMIVNGTAYVISEATSSRSRGPEVRAPIGGKVIGVFVKEGQEVEEGAPLLVLEAMKMENQIKAPMAGRVRKVLVSRGQSVIAGDALMVFG